MLLHKFINSDLYQLINGQLCAAILGALVTIIGVWFTINNDRKARIIERKNEIKPIFSILFIGIEDDTNLKKDMKYFINRNTFNYMPILQVAQSFMRVPLIVYSPKIGVDTLFKRETNLVFQIHVDGNYPIKNIEVNSIKVVKRNEKGYIQTNEQISIGPSPLIANDMFNFYHKTIPNNFELSNRIGIRHRPLDIQMLNAYISPKETVYFKVPINIGFANLSSLIEFICNDPNFMSDKNVTYEYPFDNPKALYRFLENMNSFPIQVNIDFKVTDVEDNVYHKEQPVYSFFDIKKLYNSDNQRIEDYLIAGGMSTNSIFPNDIKEIEGLEDFINNKFSNL